jgi:hypothetical protein
MRYYAWRPNLLRASVSFYSSSGRSAAWLARLTGGQKVGGSNPLAPTGLATTTKRQCAYYVRFQQVASTVEYDEGELCPTKTALPRHHTSVSRVFFDLWRFPYATSTTPPLRHSPQRWVTNAGGRLKTLISGPKTAKTESQAWEAFYEHMATLGNPVANQPVPTISLGHLADEYGTWMQQEVAAGRMAAATLNYYRHYLQKFLDSVGGRRPATSVRRIEIGAVQDLVALRTNRDPAFQLGHGNGTYSGEPASRHSQTGSRIPPTGFGS